MSSKYSAEFKAKVALEAVSETNSIYAEIASKYNISSDEVSEWVSQLKTEAPDIFDNSAAAESDSGLSKITDVSIESDNLAFIKSVDHGVNDDAMDYGKLFFWSGLGIVTVIVFVVALMFFAQFSFSNALRNASESSTYLEITKLEADQNEQLNSFGVVDLEDGVYHIPIDEAINKIAVD